VIVGSCLGQDPTITRSCHGIDSAGDSRVVFGARSDYHQKLPRKSFISWWWAGIRAKHVEL